MPIEYSRRSDMSGVLRTKTLPLDITRDEFSVRLHRWQSGEFIQTVFPELGADDREFIMTGITKEEWDDLFPPLEEEN